MALDQTTLSAGARPAQQALSLLNTVIAETKDNFQRTEMTRYRNILQSSVRRMMAGGADAQLHAAMNALNVVGQKLRMWGHDPNPRVPFKIKLAAAGSYVGQAVYQWDKGIGTFGKLGKSSKSLTWQARAAKLYGKKSNSTKDLTAQGIGNAALNALQVASRRLRAFLLKTYQPSTVERQISGLLSNDITSLRLHLEDQAAGKKPQFSLADGSLFGVRREIRTLVMVQAVLHRNASPHNQEERTMIKDVINNLVAAANLMKRYDSATAMSKSSKSTRKGLASTIRPGDTVIIVNRFGQRIRGRAVMRGAYGWVLNTGGAHGTTALADDKNVVQVIHRNKPQNVWGIGSVSKAVKAFKVKQRQVKLISIGVNHNTFALRVFTDFAEDETWRFRLDEEDKLQAMVAKYRGMGYRVLNQGHYAGPSAREEKAVSTPRKTITIIRAPDVSAIWRTVSFSAAREFSISQERMAYMYISKLIGLGYRLVGGGNADAAIQRWKEGIRKWDKKHARKAPSMTDDQLLVKANILQWINRLRVAEQALVSGPKMRPQIEQARNLARRDVELARSSLHDAFGVINRPGDPDRHKIYQHYQRASMTLASAARPLGAVWNKMKLTPPEEHAVEQWIHAVGRANMRQMPNVVNPATEWKSTRKGLATKDAATMMRGLNIQLSEIIDQIDQAYGRSKGNPRLSVILGSAHTNTIHASNQLRYDVNKRIFDRDWREANFAIHDAMDQIASAGVQMRRAVPYVREAGMIMQSLTAFQNKLLSLANAANGMARQTGMTAPRRSSKAVSTKMQMNHKRERIGSHTVETWYDKDYVPKEDRNDANPLKRPYVLRIDGQAEGQWQAWTNEPERKRYVDWMAGMWDRKKSAPKKSLTWQERAVKLYGKKSTKKIDPINAYWVELDHRSKFGERWVRGNGYATEREAVQAAQRAFLPSRIVQRGRVIRRIESNR